MKSNIAVSKNYLEEISREHKIERDWYEGTLAFPDIDSIHTAITSGDLAEVSPTENYLTIMRLRNPKLHDQFPPYLRSASHILLQEITSKWREQMQREGFDPRIRLAVTSLVRTQEYQKEIVKAGKLALSDGPHLRGEAFDIDGCGYYVEDKPVNPRQQEHGKEFSQAFKQMGAELQTPEVLDYAGYQSRIHDILREILNEMMAADKLHYLHEFPGTNNTVYHIARNPAYIPGNVSA